MIPDILYIITSLVLLTALILLIKADKAIAEEQQRDTVLSNSDILYLAILSVLPVTNFLLLFLLLFMIYKLLWKK
mgnify:CR=1 FL=1